MSITDLIYGTTIKEEVDNVRDKVNELVELHNHGVKRRQQEATERAIGAG